MNKLDFDKLDMRQQITEIYQECVYLSGLSEDGLLRASSELNSVFNDWLDYSGEEIESAFGGFQKFLCQRPLVVKDTEASHLHGFSMAKLHLTWGYSDICDAISKHTMYEKIVCNDSSSQNLKFKLLNEIISGVVDATKALTLAKHFLGKSQESCLI